MSIRRQLAWPIALAVSGLAGVAIVDQVGPYGIVLGVVLGLVAGTVATVWCDPAWSERP